MTVAEIREKIHYYENQKLQYGSWLLSNDANLAPSEEVKRTQQYVEKCEQEIKNLYDQLRTSESLEKNNNFVETKYNTDSSFSIVDSALKARTEALHRFHGMNKLQQTIAKINGQHKKFKQLANRMGYKLTSEEKEQVAEELNKLFR